MGDGGINNPWQANITLNAVKDAAYSRYVVNKIKELFHIVPYSFRYKTKHAVRILINSVSLVDFLVANGLVRGDKLRQSLQIPAWIQEIRKYKTACVRGLVDTDGCMFVHKHTVGKREYKNIGLTFSSRSSCLISQVASIFEEFGIMPHITSRGTEIYLYKAEAVARYLEIFGTSNPRISSVYINWKRGRVVEGARLESV